MAGACSPGWSLHRTRANPKYSDEVKDTLCRLLLDSPVIVAVSARWNSTLSSTLRQQCITSKKGSRAEGLIGSTSCSRRAARPSRGHGDHRHQPSRGRLRALQQRRQRTRARCWRPHHSTELGESGATCRVQSVPASALRGRYAKPPAAALLTGQVARELAFGADAPAPGTLI